MNQMIQKIRLSIVAMLLLMLVAPAWGANTKTTVDQVTTAVTLSSNVDYIITSATPFTGDGTVNITNTEHAVLILSAVRPSKCLSTWLKYVTINGEKAVNNTNCMVKLYNLGCIIMPYAGGDKFKPLTVYSESNFKGESCNDFGLENDGGYMNTLTDEKLNNRISSFKLKRGYMVTFSLKAGGRGYSRCFIAADKDLEMATMPAILNNSITSYRIFKWYDAGKKQLANSAGDKGALDALNVQSTYDWGQGNGSLLPDYEWVANHIYEDWPSSSTIGKVTQTAHTKTNNEPRNPSDDTPQDLKTILNNWENMMRTGLRLCSPASWDGSDYWNATGFLADFLDSVDARGWRCDIIDLHCYWPEGNFGNIANWSNKYKRPVWISEWCWGASWGTNNSAKGAFADGVTEDQVKTVLERICTGLNGKDYVERYYYWNGERDPSKLYKNGGLTAAGKMYAALDGGVGYNGKFDYAPKVPTQYDPDNLSVRYRRKTGTALLKWRDRNGEMNSSMSVERRAANGLTWIAIASITPQEFTATYSFVDSTATIGSKYRICVVDGANKKRYTEEVTTLSADVQAGDGVDMDGQTKYAGGNIILNGSFEMGFNGWTTGAGTEPAAPYFQVVSAGGYDEGTYLQAYGNGVQNTVQSINTQFPIKENTDYFFAVASSNMPSSTCRMGLGLESSTSLATKVTINSSIWNVQTVTFNSGRYTLARIQLYSLQGNAQVDQFQLCRLFDTKEEAIADGIELVRQKAEMFKQYNTKFEQLNNALTQVISGITTTDAEALNTICTALEDAISAYRVLNTNGRQVRYAESLAALKLKGVEKLETAISAAKNAKTAAEIVESDKALKKAIDEYYVYTISSDLIKSPSFEAVSDWNTRCGTYTGGNQQKDTQDDVVCWGAWWQNISASEETQSMAVKQDVKVSSTSATHGVYALECQASTDHYCLSDQHAYMTVNGVTMYSDTLTADYLDLDVDNRWQTLCTAPVYLNDNPTITIGFEGSKKGATDGLWLEVGNTSATKTNDKREGSWCATNFAFRYIPVYMKTVVPGQYGIICLPYNVRSTETLSFYQIAGINPEYTQLYLEPLDELTGGVPCIYRSTVADAQFYEYGEAAAKAASTGVNGNLRGFFQTSSKVPVGNFAIMDGIFTKVTSENRPFIGNWGAFMRPFTDNSSEVIPVLESWSGESIAISGVTDEEKAKNGERMLGIQLPTTANQLKVDGLYTIEGRRVATDTPQRPGLYIKVVGGRAFKTIVK